MCQEEDNTLCWNSTPEYKVDLDSPDLYSGKQIKFWFGVYLDECICVYDNVGLW